MILLEVVLVDWDGPDLCVDPARLYLVARGDIVTSLWSASAYQDTKDFYVNLVSKFSYSKLG